VTAMKVTPNAAMRARDVSRPRPEQLAEAEAAEAKYPRGRAAPAEAGPQGGTRGNRSGDGARGNGAWDGARGDGARADEAARANGAGDAARGNGGADAARGNGAGGQDGEGYRRRRITRAGRARPSG
jgi:hypothetical protein